MGARREGREAAIQFLYHWDLNGAGSGTAETIEAFWELRPGPKRVREFATALTEGVLDKIEPINERICKAASNYELHRIAAVDRNILRIAIYEMLYCPEVPPVVSINEAIEIAKRFGSEESSRFVNGVLDRIRADLPRPPRIARTNPAAKSDPTPEA